MLSLGTVSLLLHCFLLALLFVTVDAFFMLVCKYLTPQVKVICAFNDVLIILGIKVLAGMCRSKFTGCAVTSTSRSQCSLVIQTNPLKSDWDLTCLQLPVTTVPVIGYWCMARTKQLQLE